MGPAERLEVLSAQFERATTAAATRNPDRHYNSLMTAAMRLSAEMRTLEAEVARADPQAEAERMRSAAEAILIMRSCRCGALPFAQHPDKEAPDG